MDSPQKVDHEGQGYAGLHAVLVEVQSIPQLQDPKQVVALDAKEHLKQVDVVNEDSCEVMQRLWRVKLGTCSKLLHIAGGFSVTSWKYHSLAMSLLNALAKCHLVQKGAIPF
jgi:hypothetical protein